MLWSTLCGSEQCVALEITFLLNVNAYIIVNNFSINLL